MPELPEVEVIRKDLEKEISGRTIKQVEVRPSKNAMRIIRRHKRRKDFETAIAGAKVARIERKGKYLLIHLDNSKILVVHLGMAGQLLKVKPSAAVEPHTHVVLSIPGAGQIRYVDPRSFGEMFVADVDGLSSIKELQHLGIDPLEQPLTWLQFTELLSARKAKLKSLLTDQSFICGIGSIYADEILFVAGLRYDRRSDTLSSQEVRRLYRAIQEILQDAIRARGTSADDEQYRDLHGNLGEYQLQLRVYQRDEQPCRRCRGPIRRERWGNRASFLCPRCQV